MLLGVFLDEGRDGGKKYWEYRGFGRWRVWRVLRGRVDGKPSKNKRNRIMSVSEHNKSILVSGRISVRGKCNLNF